MTTHATHQPALKATGAAKRGTLGRPDLETSREAASLIPTEASARELLVNVKIATKSSFVDERNV